MSVYGSAEWTDEDEARLIDDERNSHVATDREAMHEFAANAGGEYPERCWLLTSYDVWVRNPHYAGPPVPHPESYEAEADEVQS